MNRNWKKFELVNIVRSEDTFRNLSPAEIRSHMRVKSIFPLTTISVAENESQSDEDINVEHQRKVTNIHKFSGSIFYRDIYFIYKYSSI